MMQDRYDNDSTRPLTGIRKAMAVAAAPIPILAPIVILLWAAVIVISQIDPVFIAAIVASALMLASMIAYFALWIVSLNTTNAASNDE